MAASPEALACGKRHPGIQQGTPASIELIVAQTLLAAEAAALLTFRHDRRDAIATAAFALTDEASRT
jgi:hypothetical protein